MTINLHSQPSLSELVLNALGRYPDRVAFRQDGVNTTYKQTADMLARWTELFRQRNLSSDEGVGVLSRNRPEVFCSQYAPILAGSRYTPLHPLGSFEDHLFICDQAKLRFLCVDPHYSNRAKELLEKCSYLEEVFTFEDGPVGVNIHTLTDSIDAVTIEPAPVADEDLAAILYTGGTTGVPKGAMMPHRAFVQSVMSISSGWELPSDVRYLACAPLSHGAGYFVLPTLLRGGTIIMQNAFEPKAWLEAVETEEITTSFLVPTMIYGVLDCPDLDKRNLSSLQQLVYGASPMSSTRLAEAIERIGPIFCQIYAQTECCAIATYQGRSQHDTPERLKACGMEVPGARIRLLDDDGNPVPQGTPGEICVQGRGVMLGYLDQPEQTEEALKHGWLHTGDIGVQDESGMYYIIDRKKDMIISGGFNVFPREVEDVLSSHSCVASSVVIGIPDPKWGEAVKALVVLKDGATVKVEELIALVRDKKGPAYAPKSIDFIDKIPLTAVGKPDKKSLVKRYQS